MNIPPVPPSLAYHPQLSPPPPWLSPPHLQLSPPHLQLSPPCLQLSPPHLQLSPPCPWLSPPPLWFSPPSGTLPSPPTNILHIPKPVPWSTPLTITAVAQDYSMDANRLSSDIQPTDVCTVVEAVSEDTQGDND
ncbi:hypothetical protein EDC04DRAFT_2905435 [Pisolithus marmoratus]|nr:hypothetical protein EDC04DRAFT_2905435 [Pisolithus marmoratus]